MSKKLKDVVDASCSSSQKSSIVAAILKYLHAIHKERKEYVSITTENVFLTDDLQNVEEVKVRNNMCYAAPEIIFTRVPKTLNINNVIYSFGCLIFYIYTGKDIYSVMHKNVIDDLYKYYKDGVKDSIIDKSMCNGLGISDQLLNIVCKMTNVTDFKAREEGINSLIDWLNNRNGMFED